LRIRRWLFALFAVLWLLALTLPVPFREPSLLGWQEPPITLAKLLHLVAYACFTMLGAWMQLPPARRGLVLATIAGHAVLSEFLQHLFRTWTGRTGKWTDVALDCAGILIGVALTWKWWR